MIPRFSKVLAFSGRKENIVSVLQKRKTDVRLSSNVCNNQLNGGFERRNTYSFYNDALKRYFCRSIEKLAL